MPDITQYTFSHKELATVLVRELGIKEGIWGLYVKFGVGATNAGPNETNLMPAAVVPVLSIGLQPFDKETNLSVDAAKVNSAT